MFVIQTSTELRELYCGHQTITLYGVKRVQIGVTRLMGYKAFGSSIEEGHGQLIWDRYSL